ncbi:Prominin [Popillia japonica]|uniref:Prominin n=1 Tax=Popillia japonica TaxID=7064 RepID=A0AAW1JZK4_POPJA
MSSSSHTPPPNNNNNFKTRNAAGRRCQRNNQSNERLRINLVSLLVTCVVLFAGVKLADGSFIRNINRISETLDRALFNVLEELEGPDYTAINVSATYYASTRFNPEGMAILYNLTNIFMDVLVNRDVYPEGLIIVQDNAIQWEPIKDQWQAILKHFSGLLVIVIILVVLALLFPLWGLCFCCCRCCGNCGAKPQPLDKKRDCCKKFILATFLIAVGTLLLFGVVCAFVTNTHLYEGTANAVPTVKTNMRDVDTYLNTTGTELNILLGTNYDEFQSTLFDVLNKSSTIVYDQLAKYSNAVAMTEVTNIVVGLDDIRTNLTQMRTITNYLRNHASQLNDALRKVKNDLIHTLKECNTNLECSKLSSNVSNLDTNIDFNSLPDVTSEMKELQSVIDDGDLEKSVEEGQQRLKNIEQKISQTVSTSLDAVRSAINDAGKEIRTNVGQVNSVLTDISSFMHKHADPVLADADRYVREYAPYLYYGGIGVSCVLLSVTFCIAVGLICGICGKKPDPYSEDCCNKGVGNQCLMCGVTIMFLSGIFLAVITIVFFFVGMASQRLVCDPIRNYNDSKLIDLLDESFSFKDAVGVDVTDAVGVDVTVKQVLSDCHRNRSAYHVFRLQNKIELDNVRNYIEEFDIQSALDELQENIKVPVGVEILSPEAKAKLTELADSNISNINFDRFTTVLDDNLTKVDLNYLVKQLDAVLETVNRRMVPEEIKANLQVSKLHLETYQEKLVVPMTQNAEKLIDIAKNMEQNLKFGKSSFREAITELIDEVDGVTIMFLSGIFLAVITIVFFFVGMASQRLVCDPIRNYNDSKLIDLLDESFSFKDAVGVDVTVKQVLSDCHRNRSAYHVFRLQNKIELDNVRNYIEEFDIQSALDELQENIKVPVGVEILSPEAKAKLTELADSNISNINFDRFTTVLDDNLTKVDLNYLVKQLDAVLETVNRRMVPEEIKANLQVSKLHLETYQEKLVVPMTQNAEKLIDIAKNMEQNLKFGKSSFREAITELIDEVE